MKHLTLGFPCMHFEQNEKRDFTPNLFEKLSIHKNINIVLENGYGYKLGYKKEDYLNVNRDISFAEYPEVMASDIVVVIRTPRNQDIMLMRNGRTLFSMLHFPTHEKRNELMASLGIKGVSMDALADDFGVRYIQDFEGTVKNAFEQTFSLWRSIDANCTKKKIDVTVLGTGGIGKVAVDSAVRCGGVDFPEKPSVVVRSLGRNATCNELLMHEVLKSTDILVDTTLRVNTNEIIIPNKWLALLPVNAVITDITADNYDTSVSPVQVKAIEGIPTGTLDKTLFLVDDNNWDELPDEVSSINRRPVISCYSWPGVNPLHCLKRYEKQMLPFLNLLIRKSEQRFEQDSHDPFERALAKATLNYFLTQK